MSDLARTDRIDRYGIPHSGIDALVLIKNDDAYMSFEGRVTDVIFESTPGSECWSDWGCYARAPFIRHSLTINFSGDVIERRAKEDE